jgi:HEAT repeat protein
LSSKFENDPGRKTGIGARIRRLATAFARSFKDDFEPPREESWKKQFKEMLFKHEKNALIADMKVSPEKVLYTATLLLNEDYRLSAGWILVNASAEKVDLTVAKPYLKEGLESEDKNVRCQCARTLTFHYLNTGDLPGLKSLAEIDDVLVRKDIFDSANVYATDAHAGAIEFLAEILGHRDRNLRELAASALELAVELGDSNARDRIRQELKPLTKTSGVPNLPALKSAEKICKSIELREKRST